MHLRYTDAQWSEQFAQERARLLGVLGAMIEGGIVDNLQHIGTTNVSGALARPCIDLALSVWPFPLEPSCQVAIEALGYTTVPGYESEPEQRFRHVSGAFQLFIVEGGSELWTDYLILRDYLRHVEAAREIYSADRQALAERAKFDATHYEDGKARLLREILPTARAWWVDFSGMAPLQAVVDELTGMQRPWYISGGWALDLFLGRVARVHHDVDVVIARSDQLVLQEHMTARGWRFLTPLDERFEPWPVHMRLELPRHQAHAHRDGRFIDFLISDIEHGVWHYRRNPQIIRGVEPMMLQTAGGIPFLAPELVLLYKSRSTSGKERSKDQADFDKVRDRLEPERRAWLRWALFVENPDHPWIPILG